MKPEVTEVETENCWLFLSIVFTFIKVILIEQSEEEHGDFIKEGGRGEGHED